MAEIINILDFDAEGGAYIHIPQVQQDYSIVINHWKGIEAQIEEIDEDLLLAEAEEMKLFLEKAKRLLSEYKVQIEGDDEEDDDDEYYDSDDECEDDECEYNEEWIQAVCGPIEWENEEDNEQALFYKKLSAANISLNVEYDDDIDEDYLCVYHVRLKHSLMWYLSNRLDKEIKMGDCQIEKENGLLKIYENENFERTLKIIRNSCDTLAARDGLMKELHLSEIQAEYILKMKLRDLAGAVTSGIVGHIAFLDAVKNLLIALKY